MPDESLEEKALELASTQGNELARLWYEKAELSRLLHEETLLTERLEARVRELEEALEAAEPCVIALRDTQWAMSHDYVCDEVVDTIAAALRGEEVKP